MGWCLTVMGDAKHGSRASPRHLAALVALLFVLGGCDNVKIRRGGVEPPPEGAPTGAADGYQTIYMDPADLDRFCRENGVDANDEYARKLFLECVVPGKRILALPNGASPELTAHGQYHTHNKVHGPDGKGWRDAPPNVFARSPVEYDWRNVFKPAPSETAATTNIFKGR